MVFLALLAVLGGPRSQQICQDTDPLGVLGHEILPGQHICVPPETLLSARVAALVSSAGAVPPFRR